MSLIHTKYTLQPSVNATCPLLMMQVRVSRAGARALSLLALAHSTGVALADFPIGEVISDLTTSSADEGRALDIKAEQFWRPILDAAEDLHLDAHDAVVQDATRIAGELPEENSYARQALLEAADHLRRADEAVLNQAVYSSKVAAERIANAGGSDWSSFISSWSSGPSFLTHALRRFVDGGGYSERLVEQVSSRQANILPVLRGVSAATGDVLSDCRLASKRAFDLLKYDIYNKGVPKTPESAKAVAHRLVDAAGETRHRFSRLIVEMANGIARDVEGKTDAAGATLARSSLQGKVAAVNQAPATAKSGASDSVDVLVDRLVDDSFPDQLVRWGQKEHKLPSAAAAVEEEILGL